MSKLKFVEEQFYDAEKEEKDDIFHRGDIKDNIISSPNPEKYSGIDISDNDITCNTKRLSYSLEKFLQKRRSVTIDPPPEIAEFDDTYLKEFHSSFIKSPVTPKQSSLLTDSDDDDDSDNDDTGDHRKVNMSNISTSASEVIVSKLPKLKLFNLLYRIQEDELKTFGRKHGFEFQSIDILTDSVSHLPSGGAVVYLPVGTDILECASVLNGQDLLGRPVRAFADGGIKSRESLNSNRYFDVDISFKCNNCQAVCGYTYSRVGVVHVYIAVFVQYFSTECIRILALFVSRLCNTYFYLCFVVYSRLVIARRNALILLRPSPVISVRPLNTKLVS